MIEEITRIAKREGTPLDIQTVLYGLLGAINCNMTRELSNAVSEFARQALLTIATKKAWHPLDDFVMPD